MRVLLLTGLLCACIGVVVTPCRADTPIFNAFFDQREVLASVAFARDSSDLSSKAARELDDSLMKIRESACPSRLLRIEAFAGQEEIAERAFRLSMNRAWSVAKFLEKKGIPCMVGISGYGKARAQTPESATDMRIEIAAYPRMFYFDFNGARFIDEGNIP